MIVFIQPVECARHAYEEKNHNFTTCRKADEDKKEFSFGAELLRELAFPLDSRSICGNLNW